MAEVVQLLGKDQTNNATTANPVPVEMDISNATFAANNPVPVQLSQGNVVLGAENGLPVQITDGTNFLGTNANPIIVQGGTGGSDVNIVSVAGSAISATNPLFTNISVASAAVDLTNALPVQISVDGTNLSSATHPLAVQLSQADAALSTTNGLYGNVLQGNAVLSETNGLYANVLQDNQFTSESNPLFAQLSADGTNAVAVGHPLFVELSNGASAMSGLVTEAANALPAALGNSTISTYAAISTFRTPVNNATDIFGIVGSGTKLVKIQRITLSSVQDTAGLNQWYLIKRSTADTGSTKVAATKVPLDSANAAATAVVQSYTVSNPTVGTAVGTLVGSAVLSPENTSLAPGDYVLFDAKITGQPIVLRGVTEELDVNFGANNVPAGMAVNVTIQWTEE